ncbi:MAG TPA: HisA/HisF-related TIM barrel protein [Gemmatimonadaceae bacterium]|nr:HisA/HisF-related TIM barrel protein [Gemmatimonadaceae bacterium]
MIAIPAIDLRDGACVQLAVGSYDQEVIRIPDVIGVELAWQRYGFHHLHITDLDAMIGRGSNAELIQTILARTEAELQIGGGVRTREAINQLLNNGARRVVIGHRALEEPDWLAEMTDLFPRSIVVAADVRDRKVLAQGWARARPILVLDLIDELNRLPLAGLLLYAPPSEDMSGGAHLSLLEDAAEAADYPILATGTFTGINELRAVADRGVSAALIGMALFTGAMDPRVVAEEFAE